MNAEDRSQLTAEAIDKFRGRMMERQSRHGVTLISIPEVGAFLESLSLLNRASDSFIEVNILQMESDLQIAIPPEKLKNVE